MTDEEEAKRAMEAWHAFRRVELHRGYPEREAAMKDELVNYIPALAGAVERLLAERAALVEIVRAVAALSEPRTDARRTWTCSFCGAYIIADEHEDDCIVLKACTLTID